MEVAETIIEKTLVEEITIETTTKEGTTTIEGHNSKQAKLTIETKLVEDEIATTAIIETLKNDFKKKRIKYERQKTVAFFISRYLYNET